ncbi:unnamed protein product [Hydatigera taeniaeformis]|uniref:TROVE domain-containing protein n=1 Tax=Hydatigena taeniaeformis TaxID=6205 RepID=A0A0R3WJB3_HYDTA|nr:unnamed protein product [Hydatigera taeniaeformis]
MMPLGVLALSGMSISVQSSLTSTDNRLLDSSLNLLDTNGGVSAKVEDSAPAKLRKMSADEKEHENLSQNFSALFPKRECTFSTPADMTFQELGGLPKKSADIVECKAAPADITEAKTAVYCRKVLNIRYTTNFIVAFAANSSACRPYLSKYYSATVGLPSDWLKIVEIYKTFHPSKKLSLPNALRRVMVEKFKDFDQYQLAKYNREVTETKKNRGRRRNNKTSSFTLSLKKMIRLLHISQPVYAVMSLLGKTYPMTISDFIESGLSGDWDPYIAGTRMRLPVPYTWETELSKTPVEAQLVAWHNLIVLLTCILTKVGLKVKCFTRARVFLKDSGKLPYMATLRNLRNLLLVGIDKAHMEKVLHKLTNEGEVASSKQLPFRYLSAFAALEELRHDKNTLGMLLETKIGSGRSLLCAGPIFCRLDIDNVKTFEDAVERAFDLAIHLNLPTVSGSTLIIVNLQEGFSSDLDVGTDRVSSQLLLAFMCMAVCEDYDVLFQLSSELVYNSKFFASLMPGDGAILETVKRVSSILKNPPKDPDTLNPIGPTYTSMVVLGNLAEKYKKWKEVYSRHVGFIHGIAVCDKLCVANDWMSLQDYSDSCIQILAHMANQSLVKQVEMVDRQLDLSSKTYISRHPSTVVSKTCQTSIELPANFLLGSGIAAVQVFVSSTFQDMYGERDLISGLVFPGLRKQLSRLDYPVLLNEIDLRWGVPEVFSQTGESLRMCLEKVVTSDYLILLLGERYGWTPSEEVVQALPPKLLGQVMKIYKKGMSITEMEARLFIQQNCMKRKNLLCFLRDSSCLEDVPSDLKSHFLQSSQRDRERLLEFKQFLKENGLILLNSYPASFAGIINAVPMMGNLGTLGEALFKSLYTSICEWVRSHPSVLVNNLLTLIFKNWLIIRHFLNLLIKTEEEEEPSFEDGEIRQCGSSVPTGYLEAIAASVAPRHLQEVLHALFVDLPIRGAQVRLSRLEAAGKHRNACLTQLISATSLKRRREERILRDGGVLCLIGSHGSGKTTLVSALAVVLSDPTWMPDMAASSTFTTPFDSRSTPKTEVSDAFRNRSRVFVHLTMGAHSSTTRHAGLLLCAIPQMTQVKRLLDTWIMNVFNELRKPASGPNPALEQKLSAMENELQSAGIVNVAQDSELVKSIEIFHKLLWIIGEHVKNHYIFIVDSVDHLVPANLTWIPEVIPENVKFVLTLNGETSTARTLSVRPDCLYLRLSELSRNEKAAAIRCYFAQYGKVLSDSGFGNQLDNNLKSLPEHLPDLVAHIVTRASVCCGENLVKTALCCILCSRHPPYPTQLQHMINIWLSANSEQATSETIAFFSGDEEELPKDDPTIHPVFTTMALNVLLSQLQPLIIGVESTDESGRGLAESIADQVEETDIEERSELSLFTSGGLRLCSQEVADVIRRLCFSSCGPISRFSASRRMGYLKSTVGSQGDIEPLPLSSIPTELQTYRLLLCENYDNLKDKVYYAFRAKKLNFAASTLSSISYIQQKAMNNDISGVIEEFLGSDICDPATRTAWLGIIDKQKGTIFSAIRHFVLRSGHVLTRFPQLTGQLLLDSLPAYCKATLKEELERIIGVESSFGVSRCNTWSADYLRDVEIVWRPEAIISPTALASDGNEVIACGDISGSIILLDVSSGKVLNTLYGHTGAVNGIVFISPQTNALVTRCVLLYSVSADSTACLWKLVPSSVGERGLIGVRLARISGYHDRAITACAWDSQRKHLVTAGLDGLVNLFPIQLSLDGDSNGETNSVSGYNLESFKGRPRSFSTKHQPINAMVLVEDKIVVGCWNGTLWVFETDMRRDRKVAEVLLVGSECGGLEKETRDGAYFEKWAGVRGLHASIVSLAYSGPKSDVIASADFVGEVTLTNASTLECIVHLEDPCRLTPRHIYSRLCFLTPKGSDDCLLAYTGSSTSVSGAISLYNIDRPHKFDTLLEDHGRSSDICIGVSLTKSIMIFGTYNGGVICFNVDAEKSLVQLFPPPQNNASKIQAIDCFFYSGVDNFVFLVYGSARGDVTFAVFSTKRCIDGVLKLNRLVGEVQQPFSVWPHAYGHQEGGGGEGGGTLAITASVSQGFAVSGGGDAACCFHLFQPQDLGSKGCHSSTINSEFRLVAHSLGVSALASAANIAVSGGKDGRLVIYQVDKQVSFQPVTIIDSVPQAHRDWITCLAIKQEDPRRYLIASGGNDHAVGVWVLDSESKDGMNPLSQICFATEHVQPLTRFSFKDGPLISASVDGVVVVWEATVSSMRKLRKFTLSDAKIVVMDVIYSEESVKHDMITALSDESDTFGELKALFENQDEVGKDVLEDRSLIRLRVACAHGDGSFDVSTISPFLPSSELAFAGHSNVTDCSVIHLTSSAENGALVSACTSDSQPAEVCLWRLDSKEPKSHVTQISCRGAITVLKESKGYIFAGTDAGCLLVWRVKDGRQLTVEGFLPNGCINDLEVSVSCEESRICNATIFVLIDHFVYFSTLSASTDSDLVFDYSRLTDGIVSSLCAYTYSVTSGGTAHYIGLCDGKLELFDSAGNPLAAAQQKDETIYNGLQVICPKNGSAAYILVSGMRKNVGVKGSPTDSFVSLRSDPFTPISEYVLPNGEAVVGFAAAENNRESARNCSYIVIVAGSDGILRYLQWMPSKSAGEPNLVGYFPTGRKVVKICASEPDHFAVGYSNGDVGIYQFIKTAL